MNWMLPWEGLDPDQRRAVIDIEESKAKAIWLDGFAGSGKTVILLHLAKRALNEGKSVCFITFTKSLTMLAKTGFSNDEKEQICVFHLCEFLRYQESFDLILLDEVQDVQFSELHIIRRRAKRLVIAGDPNQRIYSHGVSSEDLIDFVGNSRPIRLRKVYRLTEKIKKIAEYIFPKSKIISSETPSITKTLKRGSDVYCFQASSEDEEVKRVISKASDSATPGSPCAILLPTHFAIKKFCKAYVDLYSSKHYIFPDDAKKMNYEDFNSFCLENDLELHFFGNGYGNLEISDEKPIIYIMTYHSAKGLDFPTVMMPFLDKDYHDSMIQKINDNDFESYARLMYVASTRSQYDLILSYHSQMPIEMLKDLKNKDLIRELSFHSEDESEDEEDDDLF